MLSKGHEGAQDYYHGGAAYVDVPMGDSVGHTLGKEHEGVQDYDHGDTAYVDVPTETSAGAHAGQSS